MDRESSCFMRVNRLLRLRFATEPRKHGHEPQGKSEIELIGVTTPTTEHQDEYRHGQDRRPPS